MSGGKRKKSGSCNRKLKKARADEESKLGAFITVVCGWKLGVQLDNLRYHSIILK